MRQYFPCCLSSEHVYVSQPYRHDNRAFGGKGMTLCGKTAAGTVLWWLEGL